MAMLILKNARVLDADHERDDGRYSIVIDGDTIREVTREPVQASGAQVIDVGGKTVMPGMIDCHVHVIASVAHLGNNSRLPNTFAVLRAVPILAGMLNRGFTTVRDAGGADYALSRAIEDGVIAGPRLFVAGKALSQTGGHGDFRERFDNSDPDPCGCNRNMGAIGRVVDGVDEMRKAVREEMRAGAHHIKIMASGGVASPTDPIGNLQFSVDEVKAAVRGSGVASDVCDGACVHAESDCACREARRADHRARQSDRRRSRRRNDRAWRVRGADARHV
jgi:imidazolonepropionase-like amidohydrolase